MGIPPESPTIRPGTLIGGRRAIAGSLIGGIRETQEMLDFCAEHHIVSDSEKISAQEINRAYDRMVQSDCHFRGLQNRFAPNWGISGDLERMLHDRRLLFSDLCEI